MMKAGPLLYKIYFKPKASIRKLFQTGIQRSIVQEKHRKEMAEHALKLKEVVYPGKDTFTVYFLTGKKYWYQTAFCLYSLQKYSDVNIKACLVDDGSFDEQLIKQVQDSFPSSLIVLKNEIDTLLDKHLPEDIFLNIRKRRAEYPHLKKLTDIHILPSESPKLVLDSDMLFFHRPARIINWLQNPVSLLFLKDAEEFYGYSRSLLQELAESATFPERLNVGVAGIPSEKIDWTKLDRWIGEMMAREGSSYLQEQALTAMVAANLDYEFLDEKAYKVLPNINGDDVKEVLHHYVADSKYDYFVKGWKKVLE